MKRFCAVLCLVALAFGCADEGPESPSTDLESKAIDTSFQHVEGWEFLRLNTPVESAHPYSNNMEGERMAVRAPTEAVEMRIWFDRLQVERGYDVVQVLDGDGNLVQTLTGRFQGWTETIPGNVAYIVLISDYSITQYGFITTTLQYKTPDEEPTGDWIEQSLGSAEIHTPHRYPNDWMQKWTITAIPEAQRVRVNFQEFNLERGYDFVYLYDGEGRQVATYSGHRGDFTSVEVAGNVVTIEIVTDYSVRRYGFDVVTYDVLVDDVGCSDNNDCGAGEECQQVQCIRWPCPALCVPVEARACGGRGLQPCEEGEFCKHEESDICGWADAPGVCAPIPDVCDRGIAPVCGCDGNNYTNLCNAHAAGTSALHNGNCEEELPECYVGGCSSQICSDREGAISTCDWRNEYACYQQHGVCERQDNGLCAWTPTEELTECVEEVTRPTVECNADLDEATCGEANGVFGRFGLRGNEFCMCRTSDFGEVCSNTSDCQGQCISNNASCSDATEGTCAEFVTTFGCFCRIDGGDGAMLCVD